MPYGLISKKDGKYKPLALSIENRIYNGIHTEKTINGKSTPVRLLMRCYPVLKNGKQFFISDWACDTIYKMDDLCLKPFIVKSPSVKDLKSCIWTEIILKTQRYTFMNIVNENQLLEILEKGKGKIEGSPLVYDHLENETYSYYFENADYPENEIDLDGQMCKLPENYAKSSYSALSLLKALEADQLRGELKKIASHLHEEDNPVLMLVKFKN